MQPYLFRKTSDSDSTITTDDEDSNHIMDHANSYAEDSLDRDILGNNASIKYNDISGPARPLEFPAPLVRCALTTSTDVIDHRTGNIIRATSVLMRRDRGHYRTRSRDTGCDIPDVAYMCRKKMADTTYGSIRLCIVLKRVSHQVIKFANSLGGGEASLPLWETTDDMVAVKVTNWSRLQSLRGRHLEDSVKELAALQQLVGTRCPNITPMLDALQNESHLFCVYPYISGGDLYDNLRLDHMSTSPTGRIDESLARLWFRQILCAISHLQKKGICHRGVCMENIMVDENNNIQLIDFGLCLRVPFEDPDNRKLVTDVSANTCRRLIKCQGQCGYLEYLAPEVAMQNEAFDGFATDLWAAGIILFEFLVGAKPFAMADKVNENFHMISNGNLDELLRLKDIHISSQAIDLLQNMLWFHPSKRFTLAEIVNHPWIRGCAEKKVLEHQNVSKDSSRWNMKSSSIDDCDENSANVLLNCYSELSLASTADISDGESQRLSPSSGHSLPQPPPYNEVKNTRQRRTWFASILFHLNKHRRQSNTKPMINQTKSELC